MPVLRWRDWILPSIAVIGLVWTLLVVLFRQVPPSHEPVRTPAENYYTHAVAGIGVIEPASESISMGVDMPGVVRSIPVHPGQKLKKGELLFSLDQRDIDAQIEVLKASCISAEISLQMVAAKFALVETVADQRVVAVDDYNDRLYNKKIAEARYKELLAQLAAAEVTKERLNVRAPFDLTVLEINIHLGEYASNNGSPLMVVGDMDKVHVRIEIDEELSYSVSSENKAYGLTRDRGAQPIPLEYVRTEPLVREKSNLAVASQRVDTRVLRVLYRLPSGVSLHVGQRMDVYVEQKAEDVL